MPLRNSEWILVVYFAWVMVAAFLLPLASKRRMWIVLSNCSIVTALFLIPYGESLTSPLFISVLRDWLPAPLVLVAYHEAGFLIAGRRNPALEIRLLGWDRTLARNPLFGFPRNPAYLWLQEGMEFSYLLCYPLIPLGMGSLYVARLGRYADAFWSAVLPALFVCYVLSVLLPSLPPRSLPQASDPPRDRSFFRSVNLRVLEHGGIQANTFPSAHVAGAVSSALVLVQYLPLVGGVYLVFAAGIALGTVHGRYHYTADSVLGAIVGVASFTLVSLLAG